jgi:RHS repeat-associated protein
MKKTSEKERVTCHDDGLGKRRIKAVGDETHYWRWDAGYNVLAEYKDQTPDWDAGALQRFFVPFGHTALAEATPGAGGSVTNGTYTYLAHDHLGTSRKGYNQSQTEIHSNEHLPFGQRFSTTGTVPYHEWTGKPWDADTQMYYFPYRYYSPMMNRWTAADPLGLVDGPNLYGYVGGSPIVNMDVLGLAIWVCTRKTEKIPIGNHAYFFNDDGDESCGRKSTKNPSKERGFKPKGECVDSKAPDECNKVEGSDNPAIAKLLMACCTKTADIGLWIPWFNDCHTSVKWCTEKYAGLKYPGAPGRRIGPPTDRTAWDNIDYSTYRRYHY